MNNPTARCCSCYLNTSVSVCQIFCFTNNIVEWNLPCLRIPYCLSLTVVPIVPRIILFRERGARTNDEWCFVSLYPIFIYQKTICKNHLLLKYDHESYPPKKWFDFYVINIFFLVFFIVFNDYVVCLFWFPRLNKNRYITVHQSCPHPILRMPSLDNTNEPHLYAGAPNIWKLFLVLRINQSIMLSSLCQENNVEIFQGNSLRVTWICVFLVVKVIIFN